MSNISKLMMQAASGGGSKPVELIGWVVTEHQGVVSYSSGDIFLTSLQNGSLEEGDLVVSICSSGLQNLASGSNVNTSLYDNNEPFTELSVNSYNGDQFDVTTRIKYQFCGAVPDTQFKWNYSLNTSSSSGSVITLVFRNAGTPTLDYWSGRFNTAIPNFHSYSSSTPKANDMVIAVGGSGINYNGGTFGLNSSAYDLFLSAESWTTNYASTAGGSMTSVGLMYSGDNNSTLNTDPLMSNDATSSGAQSTTLLIPVAE